MEKLRVVLERGAASPLGVASIPAGCKTNDECEGHFCLHLVFFLFFFFFSIFSLPMAYGVLRPGSNLSCSCNLYHTCSNTGSFNSVHQARGRTNVVAVTQATAVRFFTHYATVGTTFQIFQIIDCDILEGH